MRVTQSWPARPGGRFCARSGVFKHLSSFFCNSKTNARSSSYIVAAQRFEVECEE
jgi:hypothetical protein